MPVLRYSYWMWFESSLSLYQYTLLPIWTVATVELLYAIPVLTVTISVHTVTNMYGSHSTVTVCDWSPDCHYINAHCYTVAAVQLLYAIPVFTVIIPVHTVTNPYGSRSTVTVCHSSPHCHYISAYCYQYVR